MSGRAGRASGRSVSLTARGPRRPCTRQALGVELDCARPRVLLGSLSFLVPNHSSLQRGLS